MHACSDDSQTSELDAHRIKEKKKQSQLCFEIKFGWWWIRITFASACLPRSGLALCPVHTSHHQLPRLPRFNPTQRWFLSSIDRHHSRTHRTYTVQLHCAAHRDVRHSLVWGRRCRGTFGRVWAPAQRSAAQVPCACHARHARPNDDSIPFVASRQQQQQPLIRAGRRIRLDATAN